jgi:tRNA wybutosine-synthesizing protein 3
LHHATLNGYRESGISISSTSRPQEKVLVAIRTTAIRLDIPLASYDTSRQTIRPLGLTRAYLLALLHLVNDKFADNELRKQNLFETLQKSFSSSKVTATQETKEERKIRKRRQGLRAQASLQGNKHNTTAETDQDLDILDNTASFDQLTTL